MSSPRPDGYPAEILAAAWGLAATVGENDARERPLRDLPAADFGVVASEFLYHPDRQRS